jgi:serine/threonine protein kinase
VWTLVLWLRHASWCALACFAHTLAIMSIHSTSCMVGSILRITHTTRTAPDTLRAPVQVPASRSMYSLHYTAPELVRAERAGSASTTVSPDVDVWGIGVTDDWELLTGERVFQPGMYADAIASVLAGDVQLLREAAEETAQALPRLRVLRCSVLKRLAREPAERPKSRELLGAWNGMFEWLAGTTRDASARSAALRSAAEPG